ncbi:hypothetical protein BDN67DRAFT_1006240 [Paxillus ammoniavirescens]|nr:hypothetical protein BDN67DRAFT_1006240 [Paxillus ammoniavirescens]
MLYPSIPIEENLTLEVIRAFTDSQSERLPIEDRILQVHKTELRRPVSYFWSAHDFVLGLRDAIIGHGYLVDIGILHRDVSENNIVLGCHPEDTRGFIMDLDMAIPYKPQPSPQPLNLETIEEQIKLRLEHKKAPMTSQMSVPFKADRTGTTPYMSIEVLFGRGHSHFDDMESFFYVLLLFFISYDGPLSKENLLQAHERGFTLRFGRAAHILTWPPQLQWWSIKNMYSSAQVKITLFCLEIWADYLAQMARLIKDKWGHINLRESIIELLVACWRLFGDQIRPAQVSHEQFIGVLNKWLEKHKQLPQGCNNCPFNDANGKQMV